MSILNASYDFMAPGRIVFGWGRREELGQLARTLGRRAFVIVGSRTLKRSGTGELVDRLRSADVDTIVAGSTSREPLVEDVDAVSSSLREHGAGEGDLVIGIGGGAAMDLAKAVSAMATNSESETVRDYLEGVGSGLQLRNSPLPVLAVPTTSGTGSEVTRNAVISSHAPVFKKSLRSDGMIPRIALVDPELSSTLPPKTTAATGMDALTQLIESYISRRARPIPQALALQGTRLAAAHLVTAVKSGADRAAREAMAHAALLSGLALANSGLGMAHGVAAALGIHFDVPHGLACAVMLPVALRTNRQVRHGELELLAEALCGRRAESPEAAVNAALEKVDELCAELDIPTRLSDFGVGPEDIPKLVDSSRGNSMNGNPRELSDEELTSILAGML
jgi:alcohol dehydrogenase class IV